MRHEKIIKNEDEEFKIDIEAYMDTLQMRYEIDVYRRPKGGRKWVPVVDRNSLGYRRLSSQEKIVFEQKMNTDYITPESILAAKLELWEKMKPES